jgi:guanosine-3',5'-bis(diphosphate) 3'-pyrophosphohydrolase
LQSFAATPERYLDVEWDDALPPSARGGQAYSGRVSVIATNDRDLLPNISNAVTKHDGSVLNLRVVSRQQDFCEILLDVEVRNLRHLSTVIAGLRATTGITQVERAKG